MKTVIEHTPIYELAHHVGDNGYNGCTCGNDNCDCCFSNAHYDYYTVKKLIGKVRTTNHNTLAEAKDRINQFIK